MARGILRYGLGVDYICHNARILRLSYICIHNMGTLWIIATHNMTPHSGRPSFGYHKSRKECMMRRGGPGGVGKEGNYVTATSFSLSK